MAKRLDPRIKDYMADKLKVSPRHVQNLVSKRKQLNPSATSNAIAHAIAVERRLSVLQWLDDEDRQVVPSSGQAPMTPSKAPPKPVSRRKVSSKPFFEYATQDPFKKGHIGELFRAYNAKCFTCVYVLFRKIVENCMIDILRKQFPETSKENKELYFSISQKRFHDYSRVAKNLLDRKDEFTIDGSKIIDRLYPLANRYTGDANDKAHSWFHLVASASEIDKPQIKTIIDLIKRLEQEVGLRDRNERVL